MVIKKKKKSAPKEAPEASLTPEQLLEKEIYEKVDKFSLTPEERERQVEALKKIFIEGKSVQEAIGMSEALIEFFYTQAYSHYNLGQYKKALDIFSLLCHLDDQSLRYRMGLAACHHLMKNYEEAIPAYFVAYFLDITNPVPLYHIIDCYLCSDNPAAAYFSTRMTIKVCGNDAQYESIKAKTEAMKSKLVTDLQIDEEQEGLGMGDQDIFSQLKSSAQGS